jgi:hypothetical protein
MTSEKEERQGRGGWKAVVNDIREQRPEGDCLPEPLPLELEQQLWDYALGLLEADDERQVFRWLAASPRAEETLSRIRRAMAEAGVANPIEAAEADEAPEPAAVIVVRRVRERFRSLLDQLSDELAAAAAVVVNLGNGLVGAAGAAEPRLLGAPAGLTLDAQNHKSGETTPESGVPRIDIPPIAGLAASVIFIAADRTDILVTASDPPVEGRVRLVRLVESAGGLVEEDTGIDGYLRGNEPARLEECPTGILKIIAPDGRQLVVCLGEQP